MLKSVRQRYEIPLILNLTQNSMPLSTQMNLAKTVLLDQESHEMLKKGIIHTA